MAPQIPSIQKLFDKSQKRGQDAKLQNDLPINDMIKLCAVSQHNKHITQSDKFIETTYVPLTNSHSSYYNLSETVTQINISATAQTTAPRTVLQPTTIKAVKKSINAVPTRKSARNKCNKKKNKICFKRFLNQNDYFC